MKLELSNYDFKCSEDREYGAMVWSSTHKLGGKLFNNCPIMVTCILKRPTLLGTLVASGIRSSERNKATIRPALKGIEYVV